MEKLRTSRSALIAMGLAGGVTFAVACGDPEPKPNPPNNTTNIDPGNDYGGFDPNNTTNLDPNVDPNLDPNIDPGNDYGGFDPNFEPGPVDMGGTNEDVGNVDPNNDYGGFDPPDAG